MSKTINIYECCGSFAENKDSAKNLRETLIKPRIESAKGVVMDFAGVDTSTQSFIHALISDVLQKHGVEVLKKLEFRNCNKSIKSIIATVVNYSLE